jgi:hypothetical protein
MNTENEKRLDDLFKKKLEDPVDEIRYEEGDWDKLEQLLGKRKGKGIINIWPMLAAIAAMLLVFVGWWALKPKTTGQQTGGQIQMAAHAKKDTIIEKSVKGITKERDTIYGTKAIAKLKRFDTIVGKKQSFIRQGAPDAVMDKQKVFVGKKATGINAKQPNQPVSPLYNNEKQQTAVAPGYSKKDTIMDKLSVSSKVSNNAVAVNPAPVVKSETTTSQPAIIQPSAGTKNGLAAYTPVRLKAKPQVAYRPQFTLSIVAAPDLNGVSSFAQSKVGTNLGLTFAAGVSRKLTFSTGVLYSVKPYSTNFNNYRLGVKWPVSPQAVTADCRMLDIPLNVSYQVYHSNQNSFSFGTGLSSYIMLHESYKFEYASSGTGSYGSSSSAAGPSTYSVPGTSKYFFGVMNINATYEHQIDSKVGISIQPYMKIPLSNIGYSQVKLQSTGVAIGLSWNLNSLRKP